MKRLQPIFFIALILLAAPALRAADADVIPQLQQTLKSVAGYEYGKDANAPSRLEDLVVQAAKDPQLRLEAEQLLIKTLDAPGTTVDAKRLICRHLRTMGTARCVPALEALLTDPLLSHMARYALGSMQEPEALQALQRGLDRTNGLLKTGIVNTLGDRRDAAALPAIAKLMTDADSVLAAAAIHAVGRIGGSTAVAQLQAARANVAEALRPDVDDALLACADAYLASGKMAEAKTLFGTFWNANAPKRLRLGALRGLVAASGADGAKLLVETLKSDDPELQRAAIGFVPLAKGADATSAFVSLLPGLQPATQELLIRALAARGDKAAAPAVTVSLKSNDASVRLAALDTLGTIGNASSAILLAQSAASARGEEQQVARASLARLPGDDVDGAIVAAMDSGTPAVRAELIRALAARTATQTIPGLLKAAHDDDATVRRAAIAAVGNLAQEAQLPSLVQLAIAPKDPGDRPSIENAIADAFRRINNPEKEAAPILAAVNGAPAEARPILLRLLSRPGTPAALKAVRAATTDPDAAIQDAALRSLAEWPSADAADDLLKLATTATSNTHRIIALRGYVRLAGLSKDPTAMYLRAMDLAQRADDKRLVLAGLGTADTVKALDVAQKYLSDNDLKNEAGLAVAAIADKVQANDKARALSAVKAVMASVSEPRVRSKAGAVLAELEKYDGYIRTWQISGPYTQQGKDGNALFDVALPPERDATNVKWSPLSKGVGAWDISLDTALGGGDARAAYVRTVVISPADMDAQLELGSDDAIKAWLDGKRVHANNVDRGMEPRQDIVKVHLNKGENPLMLEVINKAGGWGFCCRIRKADGSSFDGLKYEAR